jgi:RIO kinase 1
LQDERLQFFIDEGLVTEIVRPLKSGKEAEVVLCRAAPHLADGETLLVAKLHHGRASRNFRDESAYLEGRFRKITSEVRAMERKNRAGREFSHAFWIEHEWDTLRRLHAAGADVPRPVARSEGGVLMTYLGDEEQAAPQLRTVRLEADEARSAFELVLWNIQLLLLQDVVHADLSPYNLLWWRGRPVLIDFPQSVDPRFNNNAPTLLTRDVRNVCAYFSRWGVDEDPDALAADLWTSWELADLWVPSAPGQATGRVARPGP